METRPNPPKDSPPVLVVDLSVLAHLQAFRLTSADQLQPRQVTRLTQAVCHHLLGGWLSDREGNPVNWAGVIACQDKKVNGAYWRHHWLKEMYGFTSYKAGRKQASADLLCSVKAVMATEFSRIGAVVGQDLFEADDMAGYLAQCLPSSQPMALLTTDTDWLGLVQPGRVAWVCAGNHKPRVRDTLALVNEWASDKLNARFETPAGIWAHKALHGDASDRLPAKMGAIEVIDLTGQPERYNPVNLLGHQYALDLFATAKANRSKANPTRAAQVEAETKFRLLPEPCKLTTKL